MSLNSLFDLTLELSMIGGIFSIILFLVRPLRNKFLSRNWNYYIWLIVLLRMIVPFGIPLKNENFSHMEGDLITVEAQTENIIKENIPNTTDADYSREPKNQRNILPNIWIFVVVMLISKKVFDYNTFAKSLEKVSDMTNDSELLDLFEKMNIRKIPSIYVSESINSPMMIGFLHPKIFIPKACLNGDGIEYIILHELTHFKKLDILYKWLSQLVTCVHWFNPVVYLINREIGFFCELACDESIIRNLDKPQRIAYGETLLKAIENASIDKLSRIPLGFGRNAEQIKRRLIEIKFYKKKPKLIHIAGLFLGAIFLSAALFNGSKAFAVNMQASNSFEYQEDSILASQKEYEINIDIPQDSMLIKRIGSIELAEQDSLVSELSWEGEGNVMVLCTQDNLDGIQINKMVDEKTLPLLNPETNIKSLNEDLSQPDILINMSYSDSKIIDKLNFASTQSSPLFWDAATEVRGNYNLYILASSKQGMNKIVGSIKISGNESENAIVYQEKPIISEINLWSGDVSETKNENSIIFSIDDFTGNKALYNFSANENERVVLKVDAQLAGDYSIVFADDNNEIIQSVPGFSGEKTLTVTNHSTGNINMIICAKSISGKLSFEIL